MLSGIFVACLLLAQFLLMPVATEDFHWAAIGDIIGYTLSHAFFQQMYAYGWVFQWLALGVLLVLVLKRNRWVTRMFMYYAGTVNV